MYFSVVFPSPPFCHNWCAACRAIWRRRSRLDGATQHRRFKGSVAKLRAGCVTGGDVAKPPKWDSASNDMVSARPPNLVDHFWGYYLFTNLFAATIHTRFLFVVKEQNFCYKQTIILYQQFLGFCVELSDTMVHKSFLFVVKV